MNNIKKYISVLAFTPLLLSSCSESFLDGNNPNQQTNGSFWTNEDNVMNGLVAVYNPIRDHMYGYFGAHNGIFHYSMRADDLYPTRGEEAYLWTIMSFANTPSTKDDSENPWVRLYRGIATANSFLYYAPKVDMDENLKKVMLGEAHFMRGFQYFLLAENYKGAVLRTEPGEIDAVQHPFSSQEDVLNFCIDEFKAAAEVLPVTRPAEENGRITKGAAIAMLGKTYLWLNNYSEAKKQFEIIMTSPYTYDLETKYEDNFQNNTEFNKESIYEIDYAGYGNVSDTWGSQHGTNAFLGNNLANFFGPEFSKGGWYKMQPSANLIKEFVKEVRDAGYDSKFDKRLYATCFFNYADYADVRRDKLFYTGKYDLDGVDKSDKKNEKGEYEPLVDGKDGFSFENMYAASAKKIGTPETMAKWPVINGKPGRFLWKKWSSWWSASGATMYTAAVGARDNNLRVIRFAEVLFLHAEACLQTDDVAGAAKDLARIRKRAGLPEKTTFGSKEETFEELKHQKLLEFAGENLRWYDLIRWYDDNALSAYLIRTKDPGQLPNNFTGKHKYLPIPQSEVEANTALDQRPEWK
ncbi:MAG: RagB/SusD family nutrient uptake outer membrane protein [Prevotellaceae bacterium]|jgi:hypothetical protein|nr:RagB/SusD family nutrient uptake outer membrane protein [Prevotellaceae bacterium]